MRRVLLPFTFTLVFFLPVHALEVTITPELGVSEVLLVPQDTRYEPKLQLQSWGNAAVGLRLRGAELGTFVGVHYAVPTSISGGFAYRGHSGWQVGGSFGIHLGRGLEIGRYRVHPRVLVTGSGRFSRYLSTDLLFFYPRIGVAGSLEVSLPESLFSSELLLPVDVYLRRDVKVAVSAGLAVRVALHLR